MLRSSGRLMRNVQNLHIAGSDRPVRFCSVDAIINGLAALALLIAESRPEQKDAMIRLVMNMLVGAAP
ncbi:MAG TPA: hypothetical protein VF292_03725 [Rhodanobacteraceae bacterium]